MRAVILYGPPASGKDTVTRALSSINDQYRLFERLKVGPGRTSGYRMATLQHVERLRHTGRIIWENQRYNSLYVIDRDSLEQELLTHIPVIHIGQTEGVRALVNAVQARWLIVYLWCPRNVAERRIIERDTGDIDARIKAWNSTKSLAEADLVINTAGVQPAEAARVIDQAVHTL